MTEAPENKNILDLAEALDVNSTFGYDGGWNNAHNEYATRQQSSDSTNDKRVAFNSPTGKKYPNNYHQNVQAWKGLEESTPNKVKPFSSSSNRLDGKTVRGSDLESDIMEDLHPLNHAFEQQEQKPPNHTIEDLKKKILERDSTIVKMSQDIEMRDEQIRSLDTQVTNYYNDLQEANSRKEVPDKKLIDEINTLKAENARLIETCNNLNIVVKQLEKKETENESLQSTCQMLQEEKDTLTSKCTACETDTSNAKQEAAEAKAHFSNIQQYFRKLTLFNVSVGAIVTKEFDASKNYEDIDLISMNEMLEKEGVKFDQQLLGWTKDDFANLLTSVQSLTQNTNDGTSNINQRFKDTMEQFEKLEGTINQLNDAKSEQLADVQNALTEEITKCTNEIIDAANLKMNWVVEREKLEETIRDNESVIIRLKSENARIKGDESDSLNFNDVKCADVSRSIFDSLQLSDIDKLDNVTLKNQLKKVCINLQVPYHKLQRKVVLANVLIKSELILLLNFVNGLYFDIHGKNLEFEEFEKEMYHRYQDCRDIGTLVNPLQAILSTLYSDIVGRF